MLVMSELVSGSRAEFVWLKNDHIVIPACFSTSHAHENPMVG